jgi:hypothetical protein
VCGYNFVKHTATLRKEQEVKIQDEKGKGDHEHIKIR